MKVSIRSFPLVLLSLFLSFTLLAVCDKEKSSTGIEEVTTVTDIDGNTYNTTSIDGKRCINENLRVTHYRNGDTIPYVEDDSTWINLTSGAYCCYNNDPANAETYGYLYNWYAVNDARGLAPEGCHVVTDAEATEIIDYLGGIEVAGGKMKMRGTTHWNEPNEGATNTSGLAALPGGYRSDDATYKLIGNRTLFWTSTEYSNVYALAFAVFYNNTGVGHGETEKTHGCSVRCLMD